MNVRIDVKSFEEGQKTMLRHGEQSIQDVIDYAAAISADPIKHAFSHKVAVHSHAAGAMPVLGERAEAVLAEQYETERDGTGLAYVHVPFCETRCLYCMFYQNPLRDDSSRHYTDLLIKELQLWSDKAAQKTQPIHALYFGGGTPTALQAKDLFRIMKAVKAYLPLANDCEITLEGRIHNFTTDKMEAAIAGGVNRFSLGVQTFDAKVRQTQRRVDGPDAICRTIETLASYDQASVVIDLIYGFPFQTMATWENDLCTAMSLPLDGVDCYQLNVFEKSPLGKFIANGKLPAGADKEMRAEMFARSVQLLSAGQWRRLSNNHWGQGYRERNLYNRFAKGPADCLAFGSGGGGKLNGYAYMIDRKYADWQARLEAGHKPVMVVTPPGAHWHLLRTVSSDMELGRINLHDIGRRYGIDLADLVGDVMTQWQEAGLHEAAGDWYVQTVAGQFWHVTMAQLLVNVLNHRLARR